MAITILISCKFVFVPINNGNSKWSYCVTCSTTPTNTSSNKLRNITVYYSSDSEALTFFFNENLQKRFFQSVNRVMYLHTYGMMC